HFHMADHRGSLGMRRSPAVKTPPWLGRMDDHTHGRNSVMGKSGKAMDAPKRVFYASVHHCL
ncbi:MAG TPA: hypothetical protein VM783_04810, partial [Candidatus Acidoferrum sp.]|nr:hypothetical protein [Candidatus Acidoferrum sp.]